MSDSELEQFEKQLRQTRPAAPPEDFLARLRAAQPLAKSELKCDEGVSTAQDFLPALRQWLRWLVPVSAVAVAAVIAWRGSFNFLPGSQSIAEADVPVLKADDVKIDQRLVSSFDAIARLPGGEPVRFRCENWVDQTVLSDKARGLVVENSKPRVEVVAMGVETY